MSNSRKRARSISAPSRAASRAASWISLRLREADRSEAAKARRRMPEPTTRSCRAHQAGELQSGNTDGTDQRAREPRSDVAHPPLRLVPRLERVPAGAERKEQEHDPRPDGVGLPEGEAEPALEQRRGLQLGAGEHHRAPRMAG